MLSDKVQDVKQKGKSEKSWIRSSASELESLRTNATEADKAVMMAQVDEDDSRLVPLYDW